MKVDMSEVNRAKASILSSRSKLQQEIETARSSMNKVVSSGELTGKVKSAINAKVDNCQIPLLDGYYDILYSLSSEFDKVINNFKSNVKESSDSAIIDSEVLTQLESKFSPKLTEFAEIETKFETIYSGISDLVAVKSVSSRDFVEQMEKTKKVLTNTKNWMASFKGSSATLSESISRQKAQLGRLSGTSGMSYLSPEALTIYQDKKFKKQIDKEYEKVKEFEQPEMAAKVRTANNHGLAQTSMYYGVDKTEIGRVGKDLNRVAGVSNRLDDTDKKNPTIFEEVSLEYLQSTNMTAYKYLFDKHGARLSTTIYNQGAKYAGTGVGSAIYVGGKAVGSASKAMPYIGTAMDAAILISDKDPNVGQKVTGHLIGNAIGDVAGTAISGVVVAKLGGAGATVGSFIPVPVVGTVVGFVVGVGIGMIINAGIDRVVDEKK
ncbi:T7SS effector LXG polymorphic toxin [Enterococcus sp. AZ196]|uniref:T7SS effector LXG polymorphic toxin n=1 Tax=Enterococcus sp. AZ196 TaxID=2774659 RepID=UPI003D284501